MGHAPGYGEAVMRFEGDGPVFQVNEEPSLEDEEELVFLVVLVPVEFSLHHAEANDTLVDPAERLVVPLVLGGCDEAWDVNKLKEVELGLQVDSVLGLLRHDGSPPLEISRR